MATNYGPYALMPLSPFFLGTTERARGAGFQAPPPTITAVNTVTVTSKFSANPGVLASGRRPDRPGS